MQLNRPSKTSLNHLNGLSPATPLSPVAVALLIDGENVTASAYIADILVEAGKMGGVMVRRVYGNWAESAMQAWKRVLTHYELEDKGNNAALKPGPNGTDIALVVDAMDLLYAGIRHFCLVSGDSDYLPLVQRLRREDCAVLGIGGPNTSLALKDVCSRFLLLEQLAQRPAPAPVPWVPRPVPAPIAAPFSLAQLPAPGAQRGPTLESLLIEAYQQTLERSDNPPWVLQAPFGQKLRSLIPNYAALYGQTSLTDLLGRYPSLFEVQTRPRGQGEAVYLRLLRPPLEASSE